jgi:hypothetical protein
MFELISQRDEFFRKRDAVIARETMRALIGLMPPLSKSRKISKYRPR